MNGKDLFLNKLLQVLEGEKDLYRSLLSVLQQEKKAVINSNLNDLNESGKKKENLVLKIRILEEQRITLLKKLCEILELSHHNLTLRTLSDSVGEPYSNRFKEYHSYLLALIQSIQEINHSNRDLMTHSLELIKSSLFFLNNFMGASPVYYRTGKIQNEKQSGGRVLCGRI